MKNIYIIILSVALFFVSCYEDKGNYDYTNAGTIEIVSDSVKSGYRVMMGAELNIPTYINLHGVEESDLEYLWEICKKDASELKFKTISTDKDLSYVVNDPVATYNLRYKVTDKKTGIASYAYSSIEVTDAISRAYLLLCKVPGKPGEFDISAANEFPTIGRIVHNIYSGANGTTIKNATNISYVMSASKRLDFLQIFREDGAESVSSFDLAYQGDAANWFFEAPSVVKPTHFLGEICNGSEFFVVNDGGVHYIDGMNMPRKARMKSSLNGSYDYYVSSVASLVNGSKLHRFLFWDKKHERFIQWNTIAGELQEIPKSVDSQFDPSDMKGLTPVYLGGGFKDRCYCIMKNSAGQLYLYTFKNKSPYYRIDPIPADVEELPEELEMSKATVFGHSKFVEVIYYAVDNKIYIYDVLQRKRRLLYEDADATTRFVSIIHKDGYTYNVFAAANNGDKGKVLRIYIKASGDLADPFPLRPIPYDVIDGYSEIVSMVHKYREF